MSRRIEVRAGDYDDVIYVVELADTVKAATARAKYLASNAYAKAAELPEPFSFVGVYVDGEFAWSLG